MVTKGYSYKKIARRIFSSIIVIFVYYSMPLLKQTVYACASCMLYPVLVMQKRIIDPLKIKYQQRKTTHQLQEMVQQLQEERDSLLAQIIANKASYAYAADTRELREFNQRYCKEKGCLAQILVRHFSDKAHFFLVNAGSRHGVKQNMVAVYNNCLLGKVTHVYPWYSKVQLITDHFCKVSSYCQMQVRGINEGINQEHMLLRYVSHLEQVQKNDLVLSNGEGLIFPQGFALGRIESIEKEAGDIYQHITVRPLCDFHSLRYCVLLAKEDIRGA